MWWFKTLSLQVSTAGMGRIGKSFFAKYCYDSIESNLGRSSVRKLKISYYKYIKISFGNDYEYREKIRVVFVSGYDFNVMSVWKNRYLNFLNETLRKIKHLFRATFQSF